MLHQHTPTINCVRTQTPQTDIFVHLGVAVMQKAMPNHDMTYTFACLCFAVMLKPLLSCRRQCPFMTCAGTHGGDEVALLLVQGGHALHHLAVRFRVAVLEGQVFQFLLDGVQAQQPRKRRKDLQTKRVHT